MPRWSYLLAAMGAVAAVSAASADASAAAAAAGQTWPAFVLVAGLLLVGLVAAADRLFAAAGAWLAAAAGSELGLFVGATVMVSVVTALLNLDTAVAFLSPVLVHTARRRGRDGAVLLALCLLEANAGSLLLPGSNLTNLIVLGRRHLSGSRFFLHMALPWVVAVGVTAACVAWLSRSELRRRAEPGGHAAAELTAEVPPEVAVDTTAEVTAEVAAEAERPILGPGPLAVIAVVVVVLTVGDPAPWVLAVGGVAAMAAMALRRISIGQVWQTLGLPVLVGLFGMAVGLGALGRDWTGPADALRHMGPWATAGVAAVATVLVNNLPAAALLSARTPTHPLSLLIGLNIGPNLFMSGSLAWVLWYGSVRAAGGRADMARTVRLGLVSAPLSLAAAVGALVAVSHLT